MNAATNARVQSPQVETVAQFRSAMVSAGLIPPQEIVADGRLHRFASNGKPGDDAGAYVLHLDGVPAGWFGCWRSGIDENWREDVGRSLTVEEQRRQATRIAAARQLRDAEAANRRQAAATRAREIWSRSLPADDSHAYLVAKRVGSHGLRALSIDGVTRLIVPRFLGAEIVSLQFISPGGEKRYLREGRTAGTYFVIGEPRDKLVVAEGYATAASIFEATGIPAVVAFDAGNLLAVAAAMRERHVTATIVVCADDDCDTEGNPGLSKATAAATAVGGLLAVPDFGVDRPYGASDFNDLVVARGPEAVRRCIERATAAEPERSLGRSSGTDWPAPESFSDSFAPAPYPFDALPRVLRSAVAEVQAFTQAPVALVASSALAAVSVAAQAHFDVARNAVLRGPIGLYFLTLAEPNERKSEVDRIFSRTLREWEALQREGQKEIDARFRAQYAAWEAKRDRAKNDAKKGKPLAADELIELEERKPDEPMRPRLLLDDATAESIAFHLSKRWPSAGILSAEGGTLLGGFSMSEDAIGRTLSLFNKLWSGEPHTVDRRTSECFAVDGARFSVGLMVQPEVIRQFAAKNGPLARGSGFFARFLLSWPETTQGARQYRDPPAAWPALAALESRMRSLLNRTLPLTEGRLTPALLTLAADAKLAWCAVYNALESELAPGRELETVRDIAGKAAENVARLAAQLHLIEHGPETQIRRECVEGAGRIVAWHVHEARRVLGELVVDTGAADAAKLDAWLLARCTADGKPAVTRREAQRFGPVRKPERFVAALRELEEMHRVRIGAEGRLRVIEVNPVLVPREAS